MSVLVEGNQRFEADGLQQFTMVATVVHPTAVSYVLRDPNGAVLPVESISAVNSGITVQESAIGLVTSTGLFHIEYVVPSTPGFYVSEWYAFNATSQPGIIRQEYEVIRTEARSFFSYGNVGDILRTARQIFEKYDITVRDIQDYMEPADNRIDSMLGTVMAVPVVPTPPILRDCNKAFTLWMFHGDRFAKVEKAAPPGLKERYDNCMEYFSEVMSGNAVLATDSGVVEIALTLGSTTEDFKPVFDVRKPIAWRVDPDRIDEEDDEDRS